MSTSPLVLADQSPLRNLPIQISREQGLFFDGIRFCAQMATLSYERLVSSLEGIARPKSADSHPVDDRLVVAALSDAWAIIDSVYRLRSLLTQMPGWKQNASGAQLFMRRTEQVEVFRNFVQHVNNEVKVIAQDGRPLLGLLAWVSVVAEPKTPRLFLLYAGTIATFTKDIVVSRIKPFGGSPEQVRLIVGESDVALKSLVEEVQNLAVFCEGLLKEIGKGTPRRHADVLVGFDL